MATGNIHRVNCKPLHFSSLIHRRDFLLHKTETYVDVCIVAFKGNNDTYDGTELLKGSGES